MPTASQNIPLIAQPWISDRAKKTLDIVEKFVQEECIPADAVYAAQLGEGSQRWTGHPSVIEDLKAKAKALGIWNMFLPKNHFKEGAGFSNLEYGLMAEQLGKSSTASEACNCAAPDTGNMEVIARYGTQAQKDRWLKPLLEDASNINMRMELSADKKHWILNGSKWWSSGAGDDRCQVYITMARSSPNNPDTYKQQSVILVPADTPGMTIERMLSVFGYDDAPHGHGHITFTNCKVPVENMVLGEGRGFEIIQGRLGPGRIHHAMRAIGAAERALEWMIARINDEKKKPFGQPLSAHGVIIEWVARSRLEIDASRLIVLNAAVKIDSGDAKTALKEIGEAKILVPSMALTVVDRAIQAHGAMGVCQDTPLPNMWAHMRTLRIADGPDEVHLQQMGKRENRSRRDEVIARLALQRELTNKLFAQMGIQQKQLGVDRVRSKI